MTTQITKGFYKVGADNYYFDGSKWFLNGTIVAAPSLILPLSNLTPSAWPTPKSCKVGDTLTFHVTYTHLGPLDSTNYRFYGALGINGSAFSEADILSLLNQIYGNYTSPAVSLPDNSYAVSTPISLAIPIVVGPACAGKTLDFYFKTEKLVLGIWDAVSLSTVYSPAYIGVAQVVSNNAVLDGLTLVSIDKTAAP